MAKRGYKFQEFVAHAADVNCLNIGKKSSRVFVTGGSDRMVNLWRFDTSSPLLSLSGHTTSVQSVTIDSVEVLVLAGASNGTIKLWDLEEGKGIRTVMGHRSSCTSIEFHPFGEFFASGSMDTDLKIWDIRKKGSIHTYKGHTRGIKTIKFTPDGRWVVTGGEDNSVKIWDLTAGKLLHDFKFHKGMISCIDFHPHEFLLATGSADRTVKFWDLETFELIGSSGPEATGICSMVFHPDGKTLFCALDEALKVLTWEPIICHDTVEMGWSSLADLIIYEGKLLGCSYHQSRVGIWVADISLIGPYAIGLGTNKNNLLEPMSSHMETSSIGLMGNDLKSNSLLATGAVGTKVELGGLPISSKECSQSPLQETDSIYSTSISSISNGPKARTSASCQIIPKKKDSEFSSSTYNSTSFRVAKVAETSARIPKRTVSNYFSRDRLPSTNTLGSNPSLSPSSPIMDLHTVKKHQEFSIPVIVPRDHVSRETTSSSSAACSNTDLLACVSGSPSRDSRSSDRDSDDQSQLVGAEFGPSSGLTMNQNSRKFISKSRHVGTAETPETGDSIRYVAEKFERIMSPEQPATLENDKSEESASSSNANSSVKYVRGVAVQLGKTRSLVERFERRESVSLSAAKGPVLGSGKEMELEDDCSICDHLLQSNDVFINSLKSRLTKIQVVRHFWEFNGIKAAVDAAVKLPDHSVQIDFVSVLSGKLELFTLNIFLCLLPLLLGLVNSKTERHVTVSLEMLCELVKIFGPVVSSTISAASSVGVDLHAEERCLQGKQCHKYLEKIKQILPSVIRRGGIQAKHAEELNILLQQPAVYITQLLCNA